MGIFLQMGAVVLHSAIRYKKVQSSGNVCKIIKNKIFSDQRKYSVQIRNFVTLAQGNTRLILALN